MAHVFAFAVAAVLLIWTSTNRRQQWISALSLVGLAAAIEVAQCVMYHGAFEWWDIRSDTVGILFAMLSARRSLKMRPAHPSVAR